jgi:hypothetical protein
MGSFWNKKASDMTIGDTMKFTGIMSVASVAICLVPLAIEYKDEISEWFSAKFKRKEAKPALSTEEEEDWGV